MTTILPVKYVSQLMTGAMEHNNDCGAASSLMLLRTYNLANDVTVDAFYNSIYPNGDTALSASTMQLRMAQLGLRSIWKVGMTMESTFTFLREKKPVLALINYSPLVDGGYTEKKGFRGAHFLVITGIDLESVFLNDPYRTDGAVNIPVPHAVFEDAWQKCTLNGNPVGGVIIPTLPIQDLAIPVPPTAGTKYAIILAVNGLNVRSLPSTSGVVVKTIWRSTTPYVYCNDIIQNNYIQLYDKSGWVYYPYLKKV